MTVTSYKLADGRWMIWSRHNGRDAGAQHRFLAVALCLWVYRLATLPAPVDTAARIRAWKAKPAAPYSVDAP